MKRLVSMVIGGAMVATPALGAPDLAGVGPFTTNSALLASGSPEPVNGFGGQTAEGVTTLPGGSGPNGGGVGGTPAVPAPGAVAMAGLCVGWGAWRRRPR